MVSGSSQINIPVSLVNAISNIDHLPEAEATKLRLVASHYIIDTSNNLFKQVDLLALKQETLMYRRVSFMNMKKTLFPNFTSMFREVRKALNKAPSCLSSFTYGALQTEDLVLLESLEYLSEGHQQFLWLESVISELNARSCSVRRSTPSILATPQLPSISEE